MQVTYHPLAFLGRASSDRYSTRALNAAACVLDTAPQAVPALHRSLFDAQPAEGGAGLSDDRLVDLAADAGAAPDRVRPCVEDLAFEGWTRRVTDTASQRGVDQTPTVTVDGQPLADLSPDGLRQAVSAAVAG